MRNHAEVVEYLRAFLYGRVAWDAILAAWRGHPEATPEAIMLTANYVFGALDQVAAEVTKTYLNAREHHMQRGTRARARLFHALISDNFDSELELQKQALALNMPIAPAGYVAVVCKLVIGSRDGEQGGEGLAEVAARPGTRVGWVSAVIESEVAQLEGSEQAAFLADLGTSDVLWDEIVAAVAACGKTTSVR